MNKNSLLNTANFFCQFFKFLIGIAIIVFTVVFIHFQFDRAPYKDIKHIIPTNDFYVISAYIGPNSINAEKQPLIEIKTASLYFWFFKGAAISILIFLSINEFTRVLRSVRKLETFHQTNVRAFKRIGLYCLLIFGLSVFSYWEFEDYSKISISIQIPILLIALIAFILSEIFKEGNNLLEENQLTI